MTAKSAPLPDVETPEPYDGVGTPDRRPFGLNAIIFLLVVQVVVGAITIALVLYLNTNWADEVGSVFDDAGTRVYILAVQPILTVARLFAIVGLWRRQRWAWFLTMLLLAYGMASDMVAFFRGDNVYIFMFLNVLTVFYLNQREVQNHFAAPPVEARP